MQAALKSTGEVIDRILRYITGLVLLSLLLLVLLSLGARWLQIPLLWVEPLARHLVLIITFLGATLAIGQKRHIRIDFIDHIAGDHFFLTIIRSFLLNIIAIGVLSWLTYASYLFFDMEAQFPGTTFLGLKNHYVIFIIPCGFSLMTIRLIITFMSDVFHFKQKGRA